jgi:hypothetical protein
MKRALVGLLLGCVLMMGVTVVAMAGDNTQAGIAFHVTTYVDKDPCGTGLPSVLNYTLVDEVPSFAPGDQFSVWVLVCNGSDSVGVSAIEYGLDYDGNPLSGVDINSFTDCTDLSYPMDNWPEPASGTINIWTYNNHCQTTNSQPYVPKTVIAIAGMFNVQVYSPDQFALTPRPVSGVASVVGCDLAQDNIAPGPVPSHLGIAGFGAPGYSPCGAPTPTEQTTWGKIKTQYK